MREMALMAKRLYVSDRFYTRGDFTKMLYQDNSAVHANRKFYELPRNAEVPADDLTEDKSAKRRKKQRDTSVSESDGRNLMSYIHDNVLGINKIFSGPYGLRKVTYCDHTASGQSLKFIEDYINEEVLPDYGNTHTTTTVTSLQTTLFRHEARDIIRNAVHASEYDSVIFVGSGCTAAVHKLIHALHLSEPPVVFVGPYEHHSNLLPWREIGAAVIRVRETAEGLVDSQHLQAVLEEWESSGREMIGCFAAASNVTGILADVDSITVLLHKHGALAFWDYATAAPYLPIDMNPVIPSEDQPYVYKDAVFISPHKFVGGVQTPGVLIAKKKLFQNPVPSNCGGGSVFFVRREEHRYLQEPEMREEGGTPAIVEAIRAGLVFQLKEAVTHQAIMAREEQLCLLAISSWKQCCNLVLLGSQSVSRLPIFSFLVRHPETGLFLHHNFVCSLLNDVFGIQARGGCACAGPYAQDLLGIDEELAKKIEEILVEDSRLDRTHLRRYREYSEKEILRPGFSRLNLAYFMSDEEAMFVIEAVKLVAEYGWKLLPQYIFNPETGEWRHRDHQVFKDRKWLGHITYQTGEMTYQRPPCLQKGPLPLGYQDCLHTARDLFEQAEKVRLQIADQSILFDSCWELRWFLLPSEAAVCIGDAQQAALNRWTPSPFQPVVYPKTCDTTVSGVICQASSQNQCLLPGRKLVNSSGEHSIIRNGSNSTGLRHSYVPQSDSVLRENFISSMEKNLSGGFEDSHVTPLGSCDTENVDKISKDKLAQEQKMDWRETPEESERLMKTEKPSDQMRDPVAQGNSDSTSRHPTEAVMCASGTCFMKRREKPSEKQPGTPSGGPKYKWHPPPKQIFKPMVTAIEEFSMIKDKDKVLVCLSGGKDSLSLLHSLHQYQFYAKKKGIEFDLGAVTIDPLTSSYDPSPLKGYLAQLGVPYFYEEQGILEAAGKLRYEVASICSFCSRMKRGRIYHAARREKYNVLALGQHLDDLAESFLMSIFHNGLLRTMKAHYTVQEGDLRVIRPFVYTREKDLRHFAQEKQLPVIAENCPACFEAPKERHRMKQLLAGQEVLFPRLFYSLSSALRPIMSINKTGVNVRSFFSSHNDSNDDDDF